MCIRDSSISYDLAIQDYGSFGYIFRLKDLKRENADIYSFVFSYGVNFVEECGNQSKKKTNSIIKISRKPFKLLILLGLLFVFK